MPNPTSLVDALAPAFTSGFALQRLIELIDPVISKVLGDWKKRVFGWASFVAAFIAASNVDALQVLAHLLKANGSTVPGGAFEWFDIAVSALIISAGTDGFNSILKFLEYKKEDTKQDAGEKPSPAAVAKAQATLAKQPLPEPQVL